MVNSGEPQAPSPSPAPAPGIMILHLEDSDLDAEFVKLRLEKSSLGASIERVLDRKGFVDRLESRRYDLILSDYKVPTFEGLAALDLAQRHQPETPFIFVSGTMGEELAVETLKRGATDYVLKDRLTRLPVAVERALAEAKARAESRRAEQALRESEAQYRTLAANLPGGAVFVVDNDLRYRLAEGEALRMVGLTSRDLEGRTIFEALDPASAAQAEPHYRAALEGRSFRVESERGGFHFSTHGVPLREASGEIRGVLAVSYDVTEQKRAERELAEREVRYRLVADAANDAIWDWNLLTDQVVWNEGVRTRFGYTDAQIRPDASWKTEQLHPDDAPRVVPFIVEKIEQGPDLWEAEYLFRHANGSYVLVHDRGRIVRDESGQAVRMVGSMLDLTERRRAEAERERLLKVAEVARAEAESANRMKDEFLATLSHELRTPLNAILGWASILRSAQADEDDLKEGLAAIERNSQMQAQLIEDLLDISRIISGKLTIDVQKVDLAEVIEAAFSSVRLAADARGIRLEKHLDPQAGPVSGDPARLQQVAWNLLSNAAKFTPRGGQVRVVLQRVGSRAQIAISDTGQGIPPEFLPHVFERFRQVDGSTTRRHGGLGLGLSIVKQFVEMHGGTVHAESAGIGQGSTFTVALPLAASSTEAATNPETPSRTAPRSRNETLRGIRVLVVDDEPDARHMIRRLLKGCLAEVKVADGPAEALQHMDDGFRPDILLSDIGMPEQDGYDLIRKVRKRFSGRELPAAAITAFARSEDRRRALVAGFQTHLAKPVDPSELIAVVASLVGRTSEPDPPDEKR